MAHPPPRVTCEWLSVARQRCLSLASMEEDFFFQVSGDSLGVGASDCLRFHLAGHHVGSTMMYLVTSLRQQLWAMVLP